MKDYAQASESAQQGLLKLIQKLLTTFNCEENFELKQSNQSLAIIKKNGIITDHDTRLFIECLSSLQQRDVFEYSGRISITITKINETSLQHFLVPLIVDKPDNIDNVTWACLSDDVKLYWQQLSPQLHSHIVNCYDLIAGQDMNLKSFNDSLEATEIVSAISLSPPSIPVRLPNSYRKEGVSKFIFDLTELLQIHCDCIAGQGKQRRHPITQKPFAVNQILPDTETRKLLSDTLNSNPQADDSAARSTTPEPTYRIPSPTLSVGSSE